MARACFSRGLLIAFVVLLPIVTTSADRPNIVFIMVDDAGVGDFTSYWQDSPVQTPTLDQLAAQGLRFTSAYASTNCALSRSTLMTGYHNGHAFVRTNGGSMSIRDKDVTMAEVLKTAGYATGGYGKWGLGVPGTPGVPERQGFDEFVGYYNQTHAHSHFAERIYDGGQPLIIPENVGISEPETGLMNVGQHAHEVIFSRMKDFVRTSIHNDQPFFTWGAWTPPHRRSTLPIAQADPGGVYDVYANNPGWDDFDKIQAGFVTWIDRQVQEVMELIEDPNGDGDLGDSVADNTLVLFASDNGGWQSAHAWDRTRETVMGQTVNLRGSKEGMYEGGLRIPMLAYWKGHIQPGTETDLLTNFPDLLPTFAELAGASDAVPADVDGISLVPTLLNQGAQQQHDGLYWERFPGDNANTDPIQVGRIGDWKLLRQSNGNLELYHLAADPGETTNVAGNPAHATILNQLLTFLDDNRAPHRPQIGVHPPDVGNGPGARDGMLAAGRRPVPYSRDWVSDATGDASALQATLVDPLGQSVVLYGDDTHFEYELDVTVQRSGMDATVLQIELSGASGFVYYSASYDVAQQIPGSSRDVTLALDITAETPSSGDASNDLNRPLVLRIFHAGSAGEVFVDDLRISAPGNPLFGDLDLSGVLDANDWVLFRTNLFSDFSGLSNWDAYLLGDLNSDGFNNEIDFDLFKRAYEFRHGMGSFGELLRAPEPSTALLICIAMSVLVTTSRRRKYRAVI